jgi:hypothetical protein
VSILLPAPRSRRSLAGAYRLPPSGEPEIEERRDRGGVPVSEGYLLRVEPNRVVVVAGADAGALHARRTLAQLVRQHRDEGSIPCVEIEDRPDFARRGVLLDISRDKVPTMGTLRSLVDLLAEWKVNELQLYVEHTFAYEGHREVWERASPMTGEQFETLDGWCRERGIDLVPNQNSFGHMERWLVHPRYAPLAEVPFPEERLRAGERPGFMSLCPVDPRSLDLLRDLYDQLLPRFTSGLFNVGCDETLDLGKGRSREAVERQGAARVYLDFLLAIRREVVSRGRAMQFWGDIVLTHPECIGELPQDLIALDWGYEADHPFDDECRRFAEAGLGFYVCPGTSSWLSIAGRTETMLRNVRSAAAAGRAHGARGMLVTDWGDHGHWQPYPVSLPGLAFGAAMAWCGEANRDLPLADAFDRHVFADGSGVMGRALLGLGNAYLDAGALPKNASALALLLLFPDRRLGEGSLAGITREALERTDARIARIAASLDRECMDRDDAGLVAAEVRLAARMLGHACRMGIARLDAGGGPPESLSGPIRGALGDEWEEVVADYRRIWLERNRPGGLGDSAGRMESLLRRYRSA